LTPLAFVMFQDRYDAFVKKYKELNFKTLNEAAKTRAGTRSRESPSGGRLHSRAQTRRNSTNGLAALTLMAYDFFNNTAA